jgi:hypothetical protein
MDGTHETAWTTPGSPIVLEEGLQPNSLVPETIDGLAEVARALHDAGSLGVTPMDETSRALDFGLLCVLADRLPYRPVSEEELFL